MKITVEKTSNETSLKPQVFKFPPTRFMGSKERLLAPLWKQIKDFNPQSVLDLCSGSGVVSYMLKAQGYEVTSNDYMAMAETTAKALIANSKTILTLDKIRSIINGIDDGDAFVQKTYSDLYYDKEDTAFIDIALTAISKLDVIERDIATAALIRACLKKRPRGIFTYTGLRYNDGRRDLKMTLREHFSAATELINHAVFCNGQKNKVFRSDIAASPPKVDPDLVYLDPPYYSPLSDNEYVRRYHFVEAIACNWKGVEIQMETKTRKIKNYPTPFKTEAGTIATFEALADFYYDRPLLISYSSNSLPTADHIINILKKHRKNVKLIEIEHSYSFGNQGHLSSRDRNKVQELIFVAY